jgi:primosomal protein N'
LQSVAVEYLGPAPCAIAKIQDRYRFQLLIKNLAGDVARQAVAHWYLQHRLPKPLTCLIDIDCRTML